MAEVLLTKLSPPRLAGGIIDRPRLMQLLAGIENRKATLLTAPAGYGKTVLMVQLAAVLDRSLVWYQLDTYDNDPGVFLHYLTVGVQRKHSAFGKEVLQLLTQGNLESRLRLLVTAIVNGLIQQVDRPLLLVLDDYHVITEPVVHRILQELLEHLPPHIHILIASRTIPPFSLSRFKTADAVLLIGSDEMRFSNTEMKAFLAEKAPQLLEPVREFLEVKTNGWPAIVKLAAGSSSTAVTFLTDYRIEEIYEYLATEMFEQQPQTVQEFLLNSSVLEVMTPENCDLLLKRNDSRQMLEFLEKQQLFLIPLTGAKRAYRYHQLFRDFLLDRLGAGRVNLQREAGIIAKNEGDLAGAIEFFMTAGALADIKELLKEAGQEAFRQGRWQTVARWLESFKVQRPDGDPWLSLFHARVDTYRGRLEQAEIWVNHALTGFLAEPEPVGLVECQLLQARILRCYGRNQESLTILEQVQQHMLPDELKRRFDLSVEKALIMCVTGRLNEAEELLFTALVAAEQVNDNYLTAHLLEGLGNVCYFQGKYPQALEFYKRGTTVAPEQTLPSYYMQDFIAAIYMDWGELDQALDYAKRNAAFKEQYGLNEALPSAYLQLATIYVGRGELPLGEEYYNRAIKLVKENHGEHPYLMLNLVFLARCLGLQDRWLEARDKVREALEIDVQSEVFSAICRAVGAPVYIQTGSVTEGGAMLREAVSALEIMGYKMASCYGYADLAWYYIIDAKVAAALEATGKALKLAASNNFFHHFLTFYETLQPIFRLALEHEIEVNFVQRILSRAGKRGLDFLVEMAAHPDPAVRCRIIAPLAEIGGDRALAALRLLMEEKDPQLRQTAILAMQRLDFKGVSRIKMTKTPITLQLRTLGCFQVSLGGAEINDIIWPTAKTRYLLAFLGHFGEPVGKERILEYLWPGSDPEKIDGLFHTSLYYLRRIFKEAGYPDLVIYQNKCYYLAPGSFETDRKQFEEMVAIGLRGEIPPETSCSFLEQAVALYRGDYLEDLDYPWIIPSRERLRHLYLEAKLKLAGYYLQQRNYNRAMDHLRLIVELNPLSEEIHRMLMSVYAGLGDRQAVRDQYQSLVKILHEELGLEPNTETQELYYRLNGKV